ncbi:sulfite exporter TauE/SafE family protein, partial [Nonlabens mediterrranea]|nr:sulfite exporter TauE/SafE family protein [Nonlabens mediterrranea]
MEAIEIIGYIGALLIGLVLGLIGGGGSILTVPILVYALTLNPVLATAYSLFVVPTTN